MDLIDRAKQFVHMGHPTELAPLLAQCVAAGNTQGMLAVQLLARDMYEGETYNALLKAPAMYCLLAWREAGLQALVENALNESTSKNFSLAFQLLASTANGHEPPSIAAFVSDSILRESVASAVGDWNDLAPAARSRLHELMLSIERDAEAGIYVSTALMTLALQDSGAMGNLGHALALRSIAVGPRILSEYDDLLAFSADNETKFQRFFENHPLMLDPRAFQVWAEPDFHGQWKPDFIIRTYDDSYVVVEIETPAKLLITQKYQLSADATHAISQVVHYQGYLHTHFEAASEAFPGFTTSTGLVVVGKEALLDSKQRTYLRAINREMPNILIVGFDTLADSAKSVTDNVIHGISGTIMNARLP